MGPAGVVEFCRGAGVLPLFPVGLCLWYLLGRVCVALPSIPGLHQHYTRKDDIMPRKGSWGTRGWRLTQLTHMEEYITVFLKRMSSPTKRFPKMEEALEEVARERRILEAEVQGGAPAIRLGKPGL
jgi:hypothetical protein